MFIEDTIVAISTSLGKGGIGIIRISGKEAFLIAGKMFRGRKDFEGIKSHTISYGKIIDDACVIDEVLITKMCAPNTFTKEDIVEINCHGGIVVIKKILEITVKYGARIAEPGEFTKRAFLNGRIDLSQAEAVIDIINAKTLESNKAAVNQLEGSLSRKIKDIRKSLIEIIARIEVTVDYPDHDIEEVTGEFVLEKIAEIRNRLEKALDGFEKGRVIREGINVIIVGRPNVGKSSLLNRLVGKNKAIVTEIAGTTRDIIEEYININGIPVRIVDTAGIRETDDIIEKIGVDRTKEAINQADLVLFMTDASCSIDHQDMEILSLLESKKKIVIVNKIDLVDDSKIKNIEQEFNGFKIKETSIRNEVGIEEIENEITELFCDNQISENNEYLVTNVRHKDLIDKAIESLKEALIAYDSGMPLDMMTIDIKASLDYLGQITGDCTSEDILNEIFSKFCIGK